MSAEPLLVEIVITLILVAYILYKYGNWYQHHIIVTLCVLISWYFSFLIIFVLPLDLSSTVYRQCLSDNRTIEEVVLKNLTKCEEPFTYVSDDVYINLWKIVYWTTQFLTWILMPMMQSYSKAGEFTISGRLKSALIDNAIYYGSFLFICGILLIYIAFKPGISDGQKLKAIASSASNTWGLFLLIMLLGYALVDVPRTLWLSAKPGYLLTRAYFKIAKLNSEKCEAEEAVDDVLESLHAVNVSINVGHPLYSNFQVILQKIPAELCDRMYRRQLPLDTPLDTPSEKQLIKLHKQVIKCLEHLECVETQWQQLVRRVYYLEDISANQTSHNKQFKYFNSTFRTNSFIHNYLYTSTIEWYWKCVMEGYFREVLAIITGILSFCVVWSEMTFSIQSPVLSIFANYLSITAKNHNYFIIEFLSTIVIAYMCYCAYSTIFKIRILNIYYLAWGHQTNEYSLIFSGMMLSRLTPPICLNFLGMLHMDSHVITQRILETHYTQVMGHMDVISIISNGFNIYFPMVMSIFCVCTYFRVGARIMSFFEIQQFLVDDDLTSELVEEGRQFIIREKRKRQRAEESINRRREFNERFQITNNRYRNTQDSGNPTSQNDNIIMYEETNRVYSDPVRPISPQHHEDTARIGLLRDMDPIEYYMSSHSSGNIDNFRNNTNSSDVDFDVIDDDDDIDSRFGVSTRGVGRYHDNVTRGAPRNIFDDV